MSQTLEPVENLPDLRVFAPEQSVDGLLPFSFYPDRRGLAKAIMEAVRKSHGLTSVDFYGRARKEHVSIPRQVAMYLVRVQTRLPLEVIGRLFKRDHGTIMHGCRHVANMADTSPVFRARLKVWQQRFALASEP